jgi:hypothetical protein
MKKITVVGEKNTCELCGKKAELRPYGLGGKSICFACGMKDEETTKKNFLGLLNTTDALVVSGDEEPLPEKETKT